MTLRSKLLLTVLGLVAIALVVSDITSTTTLRSYLLKQVDSQLSAARAPFTRRVTSMTSTTLAGGATTSTTTSTTVYQPAPNNDPNSQPTPQSSPDPNAGQRNGFISDFFVQTRTPAGVIESQFTPTILEGKDPIPDLPEALVLAHQDKGPFTVGAVNKSSFHYRVTVSKTPSGDTLITAEAMRSIDNTIDRLRNIELIVSALILVALGVAAWWIVRIELRQLDKIAATAGAIAAGDLSQRVDAGKPKTEVGRLSEALNSMLTQIEASFIEKQATEERLRRFAADASHELRTPLTAIRGYAELFRQGAVSNEEHLARILQRIESEAARMGLMVEDLLTLARMDQGRPMETENVDVVKTVSNVVNDSQVVAQDREITFDSVAGEVIVSGDPAKLHQIFSNLIGNALAHTPPGTPVRVSLATEDNFAIVGIQDEGPGLPADALQRVFERFFRIDAGRSRHTGGTGLGLAIVKSIVDAHGGEVSVESEAGQGATFIVKLPLVGSFTGTAQR